MRLIVFDVLLDRARGRGTVARMPSWSDFEAAAPELAARVRAASTPTPTRRSPPSARDGSPRISGTETQFVDGELWIGSMWHARKARDLQRDPRFALHSGSDDPPDWDGDAKLAGVVEEITDPERVREINGAPARAARRTCSGSTCARSRRSGSTRRATQLVIEVWTPERGVRTIERA